MRSPPAAPARSGSSPAASTARARAVRRLALRMLVRDWRAGELRVLALALVLAVGGVASVSFFADRVRQALTREAHQVLGADVLMTADHAWAPEFRDEIARRGLSGAESISFVSMARSGDEALLAAVKAVTPGYPLRGKLRIAPGPNTPDADTDAIPPQGTVWLDERMMAELKVRTGGAVELGRARFRVGAVLTLEPDRGVSFMNFAPRLMMRLDDLPATGLVQPGSRISYQLLAAGEREAIRQLEQWAKARLSRGERIDSLDNARPEVRAGLDRAQNFLGLTAMLAVVLSAVAIALGTRRYSERHLDGYAVMRGLGRGLRPRVRGADAGRVVARAPYTGNAARAGAGSGTAGRGDRARAPARVCVAAAAPAQGCSGAARDPTRRRSAAARRARCIRSGIGSGVRPPSLAGGGAEARGLRVRRLCRRVRNLRGNRLRRLAGDRAPGPDRQRLLALWSCEPAAAPARQRRADHGDRGGAHRDPAPHHDPGRSARRLARAAPAGCARPVPGQYPAGAAGRAERVPGRERREAAADLSHGARAPGRHQRKARGRGGLFGGAREAPDRARVQPHLPRRAADRQQDHRGRVVRPGGSGTRRDFGGALDRRALRRPHRRQAGIRLRGPQLFRAGHERAQARLGLDASEFLFHHHPGTAPRLPRELHRELSCAARRCSPDLAPVAGLSQPHGDRRRRDPQAAAVRDEPVDRRGAAGVPVRARRRGARPVRGASRHPGRAHPRSGGDACARGEPRAGARRAARRVRRARRDRGAPRLVRRDRDRLDACDARVPARFHLEWLDLDRRSRARPRLHRVERLGGRPRRLEPPADGGAAGR